MRVVVKSHWHLDDDLFAYIVCMTILPLVNLPA
jgi:hypothetical protein